MEIRDTRNGDWHWVYNAVLADPHLTTGEKLVYAAISTFGGHQTIHPTIEQIAKRCGVEDRTVQRSLRTLEEVGYLKTDLSTGRGNANVYYLLKSPKGCQKCTPLNKGRHFEQERATFTTLKGDTTPPHIDSIDKKDITAEAEKITIEEEPKTKRKPPDQNSKAILVGRELKMGRKFANPVVQMAKIRHMLDSGYTKKQIEDEYDWLEKQKYWSSKGVDYLTVASQIHKEHD